MHALSACLYILCMSTCIMLECECVYASVHLPSPDRATIVPNPCMYVHVCVRECVRIFYACNASAPKKWSYLRLQYFVDTCVYCTRIRKLLDTGIGVCVRVHIYLHIYLIVLPWSHPNAHTLQMNVNTFTTHPINIKVAIKERYAEECTICPNKIQIDVTM